MVQKKVEASGPTDSVEAAIAAGKERVNGLGTLIAAHVIARPSPEILSLLPERADHVET